MRSRTVLPSHIGFWIVISALNHDARAQEIWPDVRERNYFLLSAMRTSVAQNGLGFANGAAEAGLTLGLNDHTRLTMSLPVASFDSDFNSDFSLGNPYIGLDFGAPASKFWFQIGVRAPLASEGAAAFVGMLTDWDRTEAFIEDFVPVTGTVGYRRQEASGLLFAARLGGSAWIPVGDQDDVEALAHYGLRVGYDRNRFLLSMAVTGRYVITEEDIDQTSHQITFETGYRFHGFLPTIGVRLPLDEPLSRTINSVVILGLKFQW